MLLAIVGTILGLIGVYGFFTGYLILPIIAGVFGIIENLIGIFSGQQKSLMTAIIACIIGVIYSSSVGLPFWIGIIIGMCFESALMGIISVVGLIIFTIANKKNNIDF
jgi:uncharacterized membrane protein